MNTTARTKLSVVIPVYNERAALPRLLAFARRWEQTCHEVVFSDGGSTDGTCGLLRDAGMTVVEGPKGRGAQCDLGARATGGDAVMFLHADVAVAPDALEHAAQALDRGASWGCLTLRWERRDAVYRWGEWASNRRVRRAGIPFGDQAPFVTRALYDTVGGIPHLPIMEDYEFALRLRARGLRPVQLPDEVWASPRRFEEGGPLRTALLMRRLRRLYHAGTPAEELAAMYRDVR